MPGDLRALNALVAEDQMLLRVGLSRILEAGGISVVASVAAADTLAEALTRDDLDVAIVDVRLPPTFTTEGLEAVVKARSSRPGLPVLVLSQFVEPLYARELLASGTGSVGYLLKDRVVDVDGFLAAVRQVASGGTVLDPEVVAGLLSSRPLDRLTDREREVLTLKAEGRMQPLGLAAYERRRADRSGIYSYETPGDVALAPEYAARLAADPAASAFWEVATASYKKVALHSVMSAKQEATRDKRMAQLLEDSGAGRLIPSQRYGTQPRWVERAAEAAHAARP